MNVAILKKEHLTRVDQYLHTTTYTPILCTGSIQLIGQIYLILYLIGWVAVQCHWLLDKSV